MTHYQYFRFPNHDPGFHYQYLRFPHHDPVFMYQSLGTVAHFFATKFSYLSSNIHGFITNLLNISTSWQLFPTKNPYPSSNNCIPLTNLHQHFFFKIDPGKENSSSEIFYFPLQFEKSLKLSVRP